MQLAGSRGRIGLQSIPFYLFPANLAHTIRSNFDFLKRGLHIPELCFKLFHNGVVIFELFHAVCHIPLLGGILSSCFYCFPVAFLIGIFTSNRFEFSFNSRAFL